jgi:type IV secretion system protein VirB5
MPPTQSWKPEGPLDTPYRRARAEWDARMGSAVVSAKNWRLATFLSLGANCLGFGGITYLGALPKLVPHVVEIDRLGSASYRGPVTESRYVPTDTVITYHLRRFVADTRELSADLGVVKRNWFDAYALLSPRGANMMTAFVQQPEHDPFRRALDGERVTIEVLSAVRVSADTWQLDWRESSWDKSGNPSGVAPIWRAMLRTVIAPPKSADAMSKNPIGLYIDEFHWDTVRGEDPKGRPDGRREERAEPKAAPEDAR